MLEARAGIEPTIKVLRTFALPLGYRASFFVFDRLDVRLSCDKLRFVDWKPGRESA